MKTYHLICNAHLDPIWLWTWEEGAAEAISTFRVAADLCEAFDAFVFNHNEVVLYEWVEEYEPELFERIRALVKAGKWHIMGGWYLQPDCNMPSGEGFVRQILVGKRYFMEKFGVEPATAINFDPFGHSRGLVQIMAKSGYDSYLFGRPDEGHCPLDDNPFWWVGFDGSRILARRHAVGYNSRLGHVDEKVERVMRESDQPDVDCILWGVGNHGGGPSYVDLEKLDRIVEESSDRLVHSTPEGYFAELRKCRGDDFGERAADINPWAQGCYTSQIRIKQGLRRLENDVFLTEKMCAAASSQNLMSYPAGELRPAIVDMCFTHFHDILPGSSIQPAERDALRRIDRGLEICSQLKTRAFFALASGQEKAGENVVPVLVYNPHPFKIDTIVECEFNLPDQNREGTWSLIDARKNGRKLPSQGEKEESNILFDWRKRAVFRATLDPGQMNRFDCHLSRVPKKPKPKLKPKNGLIRFKTDDMEVVINCRTGFVDTYRVAGEDHLAKGAFRPIVLHDNADPWGMTTEGFRKRKVAGRFKLLSKREGTRFSGVDAGLIDSVRVIEDGEVRAVVEAVFGYGDNFVAQRYKLPKRGTEFEVETRVYWNEKDRMLKLSIPTPIRDGALAGQVAYGWQELPGDGSEAVAQKWVAVSCPHRKQSLTVIDDGIYGCDFKTGELRLSLLRSPAYSAHPIGDPLLVLQDRFTPRSDQGERLFRFWVNAGPTADRIDAVDREALVRNEAPPALSFYPSGHGEKPGAFVTLSDKAVQVAACKKAEDDDKHLVVRLFEPTGRSRTTTLKLPFAGIKEKVKLGAFELKTLRIDTEHRLVTETDLLERMIR